MMTPNPTETANLRFVQAEFQALSARLDEIMRSLLDKAPEAWMVNANIENAQAEIANAIRRINRIANALEYGEVYEANDVYKEWASLQSSLRSIKGSHNSKPESTDKMEFGGETFYWNEDNGWLTSDEYYNFN